MPDAITTNKPVTPRTSRFVPAGERVVMSFKPSVLYIVLRSIGVTLTVVLLTLGALWAFRAVGTRLSTQPVVIGAGVLVALRIAWDALEWFARLYILTERRVIRVAGVLRQYTADLPIGHVQHVTMYRSLRERLFGLGTIGFATSGTGLQEAAWVMVADPYGVLETVRNALRTKGGRTLVIGLAGGIGSGKSALADAFEELGCVVVDSDQEAKEALDLPEVRDQLVEWWGERVLSEDGRVDRKAVAGIIFEDQRERARLESVVHPIVRRTRGALLERARKAGTPAVIVDAPLLFEAGVNEECDAVVFVDVPREIRLERVRRTRGWDERELERRESAQWPLERKKAASDLVVKNDAGRGALVREAERALAQLRAQIGGASAPGG